MSTAFAPGRVNLIGEHTDYTGGYVLPMAVDLGVTCTAIARSDRIVVAESEHRRGTRVRVNIDSVQVGDVKGWGAYVVGTLWALREAGIDVPGCTIQLTSNLPTGAGLSSSAAVECAVALAVLDLAGEQLPARDVARLAQIAENQFVGVPTGSMDQVASMLAAADSLLFFDTALDVTTNVSFPLSEHGLSLLVVDTQVHHALVTDEYGERRRSLEDATALLGVSSLREVTDVSALDQLIDPVLRKRARHVVTENARVIETTRLLEAGSLSEIGRVLLAGHASLRDDLEVSCPELDATVDTAVAAGAFGARMVGGGFGGSVLVLVQTERLKSVAQAIADMYATNGWSAPNFHDVRPSRGARVMR